MAIYLQYDGIKGNVTADGYKDHYKFTPYSFSQVIIRLIRYVQAKTAGTNNAYLALKWLFHQSETHQTYKLSSFYQSCKIDYGFMQFSANYGWQVPACQQFLSSFTAKLRG